MQKNLTAYPCFMAHSFWHILRLHPASTTFARLCALPAEAQKRVVCAAVKGFYPISYASLQAFRRFSELVPDDTARAIAYEIYEVEKGDKPLIPGSDMTGVLHCDQLKIMFESLTEGPLPIPHPQAFEVLQKAAIPDAPLVKAMAICDIIETTAPYVIHFYQDFLLQCQLAFGVSSEFLKRAYLDEHNLTEGDSCEARHIAMLHRMKAPCAYLESTPAYETAQTEFQNLAEAHFEQHRLEMENLFNSF